MKPAIKNLIATSLTIIILTGTNFGIKKVEKANASTVASK